MDALFEALRREAMAGRDPACCDETLARLLEAAARCPGGRFLEIGAGTALTSAAVCLEAGMRAVAIEKDPARAQKARENLHLLGADGVRLIEGDAGEVLPLLEGEFDLIFLDGPKAQYRRYFPDIDRLLKEGGTLFSDDILLFGWVLGEPPKKRKMLAEHVREYLELLLSDRRYTTKIYDCGEGLAVSVKSAKTR